ncbi:cupredoxin domain-containing protein [Hephaestia sp. GCM10023244]|uniref:cupredoxin domain-containing protein n=1 Tax=unclassified Hephaestia TaxID=2631281 RepID=UPI00207765F9|nr:cupredoxin domain-containing protein [Hephaestia sp. MAHUQ-44]MCM8731695.1 cupredoxin domain-containing protein [Hephaestia sp. MAHUQ-44]
MVDRDRRALCAAVLLVAASPLVGAAAAPPAPKTYTVIIDKMKFGPVPSGLHVGDTIVWVNRDLFRHTATARDHSFDVDLPPGKSGRTVLKRPGAVAFWCKFHPGMKGQLAVAR